MAADCAAGTPVFIDLANDLGAHREPTAEIWYVTGRVVNGDRRFGVQVMITTSPSGRAFTSVSLTDSATGASHHATTRHDPGSARLDNDDLHIETGNVTLLGPLESMRVTADVDGEHIDLRLEQSCPILYSCGTGLFPYFTGPTYQCASPGLLLSGSVTVNGEPIEVTGRGWFDRQWSSSRDAFGIKNGFTWFGLWLEDGRGLSVWDTTDPGLDVQSPSGKSWATMVDRGGAHTVVAMTPLASLIDGGNGTSWPGGQPPARWTAELPGIDALLIIDHEPVHVENRFYSGICTVSGRLGGVAVSGHGVVDTVPH
jgi:predicted secreted hydrolase